MKFTRFSTVCECDMRGLSMAPLLVMLLTACGHHQPAPVDDYSSSKSERQRSAGASYKVKAGDTLYAIAFSYDLDPGDIAKWNAISSPYVIYPGQQIRLSAPPGYNETAKKETTAVTITAAKTPGRSSTRDRSTTRQHTPGKPVAVETQPVPAKSSPQTGSGIVTSSQPAQAAHKTRAAVDLDPASWKWPTDGRVLRGYIAGNPARNGLDIGGKTGQPINAAAGGTVVYSGNGLIGYGELIIIKHSDRMLSAYAHNKVRLVKEDDQVNGGQKIAEMGKNDSNEQLLHFEIRVHGKPVNPMTYLPGK